MTEKYPLINKIQNIIIGAMTGAKNRMVPKEIILDEDTWFALREEMKKKLIEEGGDGMMFQHRNNPKSHYLFMNIPVVVGEGRPVQEMEKMAGYD